MEKGVYCFRERICEPKDTELRQLIHREAHSSPYAMHPGRNKMYYNLHKLYWWPGIKREKLAKLYVSEIVRLHGTDGQSERMFQILKDMLRSYVIEFRGSWEDYLPLAEFAYNNSYQSSIQMEPYKALYGRRCHTPSCWIELGERRVLGPELVSDTEDKFRLIRD
ncbi:uncharacterized protein LOC128295402 [Gossypium arboreum]|uniref:uncharacterized protein LOC128295402 n=1 Tax=Gossypium arboreum TaxID=29729 RepID=UPI0022F145E2|nr:uncharacterized protein LOC128295402 [Gossypium arboreum]